ncbi:MAG: polysaccharide deacetylase family protein, partial [Bacteroidales bacterium]|nr:polysaccharide deacetylase family protein [Bacteroidales bacterium]
VYLRKHENGLHLGLDIFGSAFFMLSRYEEAVKSERDSHDRFPATASLAYQADFLHRPIVNEYVEILWACIKTLWPNLQRKHRQFRILVSCDVDTPINCWAKNIKSAARKILGDILKRRNFKEAFNSFYLYRNLSKGLFEKDPFYTFEWIMDICDEAGVVNTFNFICDHSNSIMDGCYNINDPMIRHLLRRIHKRGHLIGLHASYNTYQDAEQTRKEFEILKRVCVEEGIKQSVWGSRQHYLRWQTSTTFMNLNDAGLDYDSTLSFAEQAGFRCGTCYEYRAYDLNKKKSLNIYEKPLIVMECSIISDKYMGLGTSKKALQVFLSLKKTCQQFNGDFTLLWHNSQLVEVGKQGMYEAII